MWGISGGGGGSVEGVLVFTISSFFPSLFLFPLELASTVRVLTICIPVSGIALLPRRALSITCIDRAFQLLAGTDRTKNKTL